MSTEQLKNLVIDKISEIEDENFLQAIKTILDTNKATAGIYKLTEEQKQKVKIGLTQLDNGQIISNEDLEKEEDEWLRK
ncbi:hypothetical protein HUW51_09635 [Adhaeribacter swui]|uniref:Uncharacterized protein n=1 Tax=Adhaeribacter swui TaxID=2086471 RepID=A0A7G7G747_9BACT|nr:hypothetical protein [Adhaeribacter swui]QNF32981.1 hypothetical protein HUW51_09635 [Adhaeribacter swui]